VQHEILVAQCIGVANRGVYVIADHRVGVVGGNERCDGRAEEIIERRLAALLCPGRHADILGRGQPLAGRQPANVRVMPDLVGRFE
jgi:hypothetical protein